MRSLIPYICFLPISMFLLFVIGGCVIIIAIIAVMVKRLRLTKQSEQLSAKIRCIPSYESNRINEERRFAISTLNERFFADIATDLEACFANCYITFYRKRNSPVIIRIITRKQMRSFRSSRLSVLNRRRLS